MVSRKWERRKEREEREQDGKVKMWLARRRDEKRNDL